MRQDRYGTLHQTESAAAVAFFEQAVHALAAHRPGVAEALASALQADPDFAAAHALQGLATVTLAREELMPVAAQAHRDAEAALALRGGSASDHALVEALGHAAGGGLRAAADRLDAHLDADPHTFVAAKLSHALHFMAGDLSGMLTTTARIVDAWSEDRPGYGFLLGCHAFALEELGAPQAAERVGRRAVALEPDDAWGLHAVGHVCEREGRTADGIAWLEAHRASWSGCNNFSFHLAWHLALFHLERGDYDAVLDLYDREVRPVPTDDFRDVANAVSLLWRLDQEGVAIGARWQDLREVALKRRRDATLSFAALHNLLALVALGEIDAARGLRQVMSRTVEAGTGDQAAVLDLVGRDLATTILGFTVGGAPRVALAELAERLTLIGGSHAQRDVFLRTLATTAADRGERDALAQILAVRRKLKRDDRFAALVQTRLDAVEARSHRRIA